MNIKRGFLGLAAMPILALACRPTITSVRKETFQAVEVILPDPAQAYAMAERLGSRLGVPVYEPRLGAVRVLRLQPRLGDRGSWGGSLPKTLLINAGLGALVGVTIPFWVMAIPTPLATFEELAAVGLVLGLGMGVRAFLANQEQFRQLGYHPAACAFLDTQVVLQGDTGGYATLVKYPAIALDVRPHLQPLAPEARTPAEIRRVSLMAYADALGEYLVKHGIPARTP